MRWEVAERSSVAAINAARLLADVRQLIARRPHHCVTLAITQAAAPLVTHELTDVSIFDVANSRYNPDHKKTINQCAGCAPVKR